MKLVTFTADGLPELGIVRQDRDIVALTRALPGLASSMVELIARWDEASASVHAVADDRKSKTFAMEQVRLLAPIARPGKIMAIGLNYADHIAESGMATPEHQIWFSKASTSTNGPYDVIEIPTVSQAVDYEAELVAVVGSGGRHIDSAHAAACIFGYCVGNDVTERLWQHRTPQWVLGKSFDTHAPFGPWITTADEVGDPHSLGIRAFVNGAERQNSNTRHLVFNVWEQIAHLSQAMTLEPGDLLFTGTPGGIGAAMDPRMFLKDGDVVRIEIDRLGALENTCRAEVSQ